MYPPLQVFFYFGFMSLKLWFWTKQGLRIWVSNFFHNHRKECTRCFYSFPVLFMYIERALIPLRIRYPDSAAIGSLISRWRFAVFRLVITPDPLRSSVFGVTVAGFLSTCVVGPSTFLPLLSCFEHVMRKRNRTLQLWTNALWCRCAVDIGRFWTIYGLEERSWWLGIFRLQTFCGSELGWSYSATYGVPCIRGGDRQP